MKRVQALNDVHRDEVKVAAMVGNARWSKLLQA